MTTITPRYNGYEIKPTGSRGPTTNCYRIHTLRRTPPYHFLNVEITENNGKFNYKAEGEIDGYVERTASDLPTNPAALEHAETFFVSRSILRKHL